MDKQQIIEFINEEVVVCLDTNVYLNIYEYNPHVSDAYVDMANEVLDYLVLPSTVEREFRKNHRTCKGRQSKKFSNIESKFGSSITSMSTKLVKQFEILNDFAFPNVDRLQSDVESKIEELTSIIEDYVTENHVVEEMTDRFTDDDRVESLVQELIKKNRILEPMKVEKIYEICEEGEKRYKDKVPPGYGDLKNKTGVRLYNDLIIWKEILEYCKMNKKNLIFVTDDVKPDWYHLSGECLGQFRHELVKEFNDKTGHLMIGMTSKSFFEAVSEKYGMKIPSIVESVLDFDIDNYIEYLLDDSLEDSIRESLSYSDEEFVNIDSLTNYGGSSFEYEDINEFEYKECIFEGCFDNNAIYTLRFAVKATISTREYWGRDDDTKETILSDKHFSDIEGEIYVELTRLVDTYLDSIIEDYDYDKFIIVRGDLSEIYNYYEDDLCVECGRSIGEVSHYSGGMVCTSCAVVDFDGDICPCCGRKVPFKYMAGNGFCITCSQENPNL